MKEVRHKRSHVIGPHVYKRIGKLIETESRYLLFRAAGIGKVQVSNGSDCYWISFESEEDILRLDYETCITL